MHTSSDAAVEEVCTSPVGRLLRSGRSQWLLLVGVCCAAILLSFHHTVGSMVETWYVSRSYSHCFLILPLFFYLIWEQRDQIAGLTPKPNFLGLLVLATLLLAWLMANLAEVKIVQQMAVVSIFITVLWTLMGTAVIRLLAFPLLFLYFLVPFGTSLIRPLQSITTWFVIHALNLSRVPAVWENHTIWLSSGVWTVAEACSGIRFLLSAVVLGAFFSFLMYRSWWRRLAFICASIIVPVVGNGLRAYGVILLGHFTDKKMAAGVDHVVYGAIFSIAVQLVLIVGGLRWREGPATDAVRAASAASADARPTHAAWLAAAAACVLIVSASLASARLWNRTSPSTAWADPPVFVAEPWQSMPLSDTSWIPELRGADRQFMQSYWMGTSHVDLDWAVYSGRHEIAFTPDADGLINRNSWKRTEDGLVSMSMQGRNILIHRTVIQSGVILRTVWTWYYVGGEFTADRMRVRVLQAKARLVGGSPEVAVFNVSADNLSDGSNPQAALLEFLAHASFLTLPSSPTV